MLASILAVIKALPILDQWFQQLAALYVSTRLADMKKDNLDAIRKALVDHDQRPLEHAIDSPTAGLPSGDAGAVIVDGPPPGT